MQASVVGFGQTDSVQSYDSDVTRRIIIQTTGCLADRRSTGES